jgi:hypothetical protein
MHLLGKVLIDLIVTMFFVGLAGSAIVILISFVEDFRELFGSDEVSHEPTAAPHSAAAPAMSSRVAVR